MYVKTYASILIILPLPLPSPPQVASAAVLSKATVVVMLNHLLIFLFYLVFWGAGELFGGGGDKPVFSLVKGYVLWFEVYSNVPLV